MLLTLNAGPSGQTPGTAVGHRVVSRQYSQTENAVGGLLLRDNRVRKTGRCLRYLVGYGIWSAALSVIETTSGRIRVRSKSRRFEAVSASKLGLLRNWVCFETGAVSMRSVQAAGASSVSRWNGNPNPRNNSRDSSSLFPLITIVMFIPWGRSSLSGFNSGNTYCSFRPRL